MDLRKMKAESNVGYYITKNFVDLYSSLSNFTAGRSRRVR